MSDQERIEQFLTLFKELESEVLKINGDCSDDYVNFSRALNNVYHFSFSFVLSVPTHFTRAVLERTQTVHDFNCFQTSVEFLVLIRALKNPTSYQ